MPKLGWILNQFYICWYAHNYVQQTITSSEIKFIDKNKYTMTISWGSTCIKQTIQGVVNNYKLEMTKGKEKALHILMVYTYIWSKRKKMMIMHDLTAHYLKHGINNISL